MIATPTEPATPTLVAPAPEVAVAPNWSGRPSAVSVTAGGAVPPGRASDVTAPRSLFSAVTDREPAW